MNYIEKAKFLKGMAGKKQLDLSDIRDFISEEKTFDEIEAFHTFLIDEILTINEGEQSHINKKLTEDNIKFSELADKFENKKIGSSIYFFNNENRSTYLFGDIHGDSLTPMHYIEQVDFFSKVQKGEDINLIFLGDYVDRGHEMLKTLEFLLLLKYIFPRNVFFLKGNHDGGSIVSDYEYKLCVGRNQGTTDEDYFTAMMFNRLKKEGKTLDFLRKYHQFFDNLCNLAVIYDGGRVYFLTHGGIPRPACHSYEHISSISAMMGEEIKDYLGDTPRYNMLWSDPDDENKPDRGRRRFYFHREDFEDFCRRFAVDMVIRGHEAFGSGAKEFYEGRLLTIFSSGIIDFENNETAYKNITPCIYKIKGGEGQVIR